MEQYNKELAPVHYNAAAITDRHYSMKKNYLCFRMHWHERMEIIRVCEGEMYVTSGNQTMKLCAGELTVFPPRMPHKGYTEESNVKYDVLMFDIRSFYNDTPVCQQYLSALYDGRINFNRIITDEETICCFDQIISNSKQESLGIIVEIYKLLHLFFERNISDLSEKVSENDKILEMIRYIEAHFSENLTVDMCATQFGYSKEHFCRKFKNATGLTPMNYLKIYRMEEAYKMLKQKENRIQLIAESCGFDDANYFTRCFKAHFGIAPSKILSR